MEGTTSLSRRYRPKQFGDLVDQAHVRLTLEREIITGRIGHAYLFTGPRGVGKTTTARLLAKAINCKKRTAAEPCDACPSCQEFGSGRALDLIELDAASHTQVDNVRENIIPSARTRPSSATFKVFIIDEVHMLSLSAFNALLKILEEPPDYVVFILATTDADRVPDTIISRCQRFDFHRLGVDDLIGRLERIATGEQITIERSVLETIAELADGSVRDAESLLGQVLALGEKSIDTATANLVLPKRDRTRVIAYLNAIGTQATGSALEALSAAIDDGTAAEQFYDELVRLTRMALRSTYEPKAKVDADLVALGRTAGPKKLTSLLRGLLELEPLMSVSPIPQLPLEIFAVEQAGPAGSASPVRAAQPEPPPSPLKTLEQESLGQVMADKPAIHTPPTKKPPELAAELPPIEQVSSQGEMSVIWAGLLMKAQESNHGLAVLLNVCRPRRLTHDEFVVESQFAFHKDRLQELKNRQILEGHLRELTGRSIQFVCEQSVALAGDTPEAQAMQSDAKPASPREAAVTGNQPAGEKKSSDDATWERVLQTFGA